MILLAMYCQYIYICNIYVYIYMYIRIYNIYVDIISYKCIILYNRI